MDVSIASFTSLYQLTTGRALFALQGIAGAVATRDEDLSDIQAHIKKARKHLEKTRALEAEFAVQGASRGSSAAAAVDVRLDRAIVALRDVLQAHATSDDGDASETAQGLLTVLFPRGVTAITQATFVDELSLVEGLLGLLAGPHASAVEALGIERFVGRIRTLARDYAAALAKPDRPRVDFDQVRAARRASDDFLREILVMIAGRFPFSTKEHVAARAALLTPLLKQHEAVGSYLRGRRAVQDVDPSTGEPTTPTDGAPVGPPAPVDPTGG